MKITLFALASLGFLLPGLSRADSDAFFQDLGTQLSGVGLPVSDSTVGENNGFGDSEGTSLGCFWLVKKSGEASKSIVPVTGLPFQKALRVQSDGKVPDETWQHLVAQRLNGSWKAGDIGLLIYSVHSVDIPSSSLTVAITGTDQAKLVDMAPTPGPQWVTYYVPFTAPGDLSKALLSFYFGSQQQTLEIAGVAVYDLGTSVTMDALQAAIAKLPTTPGSGPNGK